MLTQTEVMNTFAEKIKMDGKRAKKFATVHARQLTEPETIVTVLKDGYNETGEVTWNAGDFIVKNPDGEIYGMPQSTFEKKYTMIHEGMSKTEWDFYQAKGEGLFYRLEGDMSFKTTWGEQHMRKGDYLCMPLPDRNEIYGIGFVEFNNTYRFV